MQTSPMLRLWADEESAPLPEIVLFQVIRGRDYGDPLRRAIARARQALLGRQQPDGGFAEPRPLDPRSLSTLVLSTVFLEPRDLARLRPAARALLDSQRADGCWSAAEGGPADLSATVLAYFALKLSGQSPASEPMVCARRAILSYGGLTKIDNGAKIWLAIFGQVHYDAIDGKSVERLMLKKAEDNADLCRAIVTALRPRRHIGVDCGVRELLLTTPQCGSPLAGAVSRFLRARRILPLRRKALAAARARLLSSVQQWGAASATDVPSPEELAWTSVVLDILGMTADTAPRGNVAEAIERLIDMDAETPMLRSPTVPLSEAVQMAAALAASGLDSQHAGLRQTLAWLCDRKITTISDAAQLLHSPSSRPAQTDADHHILPPPLQACTDEDDTEDCDELEDEFADLPKNQAAPAHDTAWLVRLLLDTQRVDGAWPAALPLKRNRMRGQLADLEATALAVSALAEGSSNVAAAALKRAAAWLRARQQPDGSWRTIRSGSTVAATSLALRALIAAGSDAADEAVVAGAEWLISHQQSGGGWGDANSEQSNPIAGEGPSTPRHTAAALLGLLAAGRGTSDAVARGAEYLISAQSAGGEWASSGNNMPATLLDTAQPLLALSHYAARPRASVPRETTLMRIASFS